MHPTPIWGLEIGETAITAVRVRRSPEGPLDVLEWWTVPVAAGEDPLSIAVAAVRRRRLQDHGLQVVLPSRGGVCRTFRIAADDADLPDAELAQELQDFTAYDGREVELRWRRLGDAGALDFRVAAARREILGRTEAAFREAGLTAVGISLVPVALIHAAEGLGVAPRRGYLLQMEGTWSRLLAVDGAQSVQYLLPWGCRDLEADLARRAPGASAAAALDRDPATAADPAAALLDAALAPFAADVRRAMDYHRSLVKGTGEETFLPVGPAASRPGLRAALVRCAQCPGSPPPALTAGVRAGPRVRPELLQAALPSLLAPLAAAAAALDEGQRDLEFRTLPQDLPAPRERTLYPLAAAVLAACTAASILYSLEVGGARRPPGASPVTGEATAERRGAVERLGRASGAVERAASLRRALATLDEAAPDGRVPGAGLVALRVTRIAGGHALDVWWEGGPRVGPGPAAGVWASLADRGWTAEPGGDRTLLHRTVSDAPPGAADRK